jgi:hypothetical protein
MPEVGGYVRILRQGQPRSGSTDIVNAGQVATVVEMVPTRGVWVSIEGRYGLCLYYLDDFEVILNRPPQVGDRVVRRDRLSSTMVNVVQTLGAGRAIRVVGNTVTYMSHGSVFSGLISDFFTLSGDEPTLPAELTSSVEQATSRFDLMRSWE